MLQRQAHRARSLSASALHHGQASPWSQTPVQGAAHAPTSQSFQGGFMSWSPLVHLGSGGGIWEASDCGSHARAGERGESWDGRGEPETRRRVWEDSRAHTPARQKSCKDKERSGTRPQHDQDREFWWIKSHPSILQDYQSPLFPLMTTVLWHLKDLESPRNPSSLSAATKRRMKRVSGAALQPLSIFSCSLPHKDPFSCRIIRICQTKHWWQLVWGSNYRSHVVRAANRPSVRNFLTCRILLTGEIYRICRRELRAPACLRGFEWKTTNINGLSTILPVTPEPRERRLHKTLLYKLSYISGRLCEDLSNLIYIQLKL